MADPETPSPAPLDTKELQEAVSTIGPLAAEIIKIAKIAKKKGKAAAAAEFMKNVIPGTPLYTLVTQAIEGADKIPAEVKDLNMDEIEVIAPMLLTQGFIIFKAIRTPVE
jgi:hypothetical protein